MINTQYINLNMIPSGVMPTLYASQYDVGRPLGLVVYNGAESVDLDVYTCTIEATRTDGTAITAAVTTDDNIGAFVTTATMTNQADQYLAKLVLFDSNSRRVASLAFIMCVTPATMDENAESIEEDASLYQQYTGTVQTIIAEIRSDLEAEIANRQSAISAEAAARQAADGNLQANINAEVSARQYADNALQSNIDAEASTRAAQDALLQAQIDEMVAPSGEAPSAAEVQNARIGADGITYPTLGDAIRSNDLSLKGTLDEIIQRASVIVPIAEQSSYFSSVYTGGYYDGSGRWVASGYYSNVQLDPIDRTYQIGINANSELYVQICLFNGTISEANFVARYRTSDGNLPTYSNMMSIPVGYTVVVTRQMGDTVQYCDIKTDWGSEFEFTEETQDIILNVPSVFIQYTSGSGADSSTAKVDVWIKQKHGVLKYAFVHTIKADINSNIWRIERAYKCDAVGEIGTPVTDTAEWECALKIHGRSDFAGGFLHGDEIATNIIFFVDDIPANITAYTDLTNVKEFRVVQKSDLYDPNDSTTIFATHGSEHIFDDRLTIKQSVGFSQAVTMDRSFLAMFPPLKTFCDKYYQDTSFNPMTIDLSSDITRPNAKAVTLYKSTGGFYGEMAIKDYPNYASGNYLLMTDNGGRAYNKCYFVVCGNNESVANSTIWKSETVYDIQL